MDLALHLPRPLESKVIQIQSDHSLGFSPPVADMERFKVICPVQSEERTWVSPVRSPSTLPVLVVLALEPLLSSFCLMLLFTTLSPRRDGPDLWRWFFLSDGCMAQRSRCPGGRPSVSANKGIHAYCSVVKWQLYKPSMNTEYDQQSPRVPISVFESNSILQ